MVTQFPYTKVTIPERVRLWKNNQFAFHPLLRIGLFNNGNLVKTEAYIDTGAQYCFFNSAFSKPLGIKDYKNTNMALPLSGIGGLQPQNIAYFHELELVIFKDWKDLKLKNSWRTKVKIGFLEKQIAFAGVLGAYGFLDRFSFKASIPNGYFEIAPLYEVED